MRVGIITSNYKRLGPQKADALSREDFIYQKKWWLDYDIIVIYLYDHSGYSIEQFTDIILSAPVQLVIISESRTICQFYECQSRFPLSTYKYSDNSDNPWGLNHYERIISLKPRWGSFTIYDKYDGILVSMNRRVLWYYGENYQTCMQYVEKMTNLTISPSTMKHICDSAAPLFRAFIICIRRWRVPKPVIWIIINWWYFCE